MNLKSYFEKHLLLLLILFNPLLSFSQQISEENAEKFINYLIYDKDNLDNFIDSSEIEISNRFNIHYKNVSKKYMISYDIDVNIKKKIRQNEIEYTVLTRALNGVYSKVIFNVSQLNYQIEFFFKNKMLISPITYYTKDWNRIESPNFIFIISDTTLFNQYCIDNLEDFYLKMSSLLSFNKSQLNRIKSEKIYYFLCKDEKEIKQLTGFNTRGMYILAFDYIVTTFNSHYHELSHLLINYKFQSLPLYTHPFFQEGFAVAFGGRGGKEPNIILNLGSFLVKSNFLDYTSLQNKNDFYKYDVSLSYPVSGLYNLFLINKIGIERYLKIYQKYSGSAQEIELSRILQKDLLEFSLWQDFINNLHFSRISFEEPKSKLSLVFKNESIVIYEDSEKYYFYLKDTILIKSTDISTGYKSKMFYEIFPNREYNGEKYVILISESELSIYNLYTNNLIDNFANSFSVTLSSIPNENGIFRFSIPKNLFDEELKNECVFYN
jgi:hypothetical protein